MISKDATYFGITPDFEVHLFPHTQREEMANDPKLSQFVFILERKVKRLSNTGNTQYWSTNILNNKLNPSSLAVEGVSITSISDEYWWSMGSFEIDKSEIFFPNYDSIDFDENVFLYTNLIRWQILREQSGFPVCFIKFRDAFG